MKIVIAMNYYFDPELLKQALAQNPMSRTCLVYMTPEQFLNLTTPGMDKERQDIVDGLVAKGILFNELPYLGVVNTKDGNVEVAYDGEDHEGRHRARALLGKVKAIPVRIVSKEGPYGSYRWGRTKERPKLLIGNRTSIKFPKTLPYK